jgi:hypothetical protein
LFDDATGFGGRVGVGEANGVGLIFAGTIGVGFVGAAFMKAGKKDSNPARALSDSR